MMYVKAPCKIKRTEVSVIILYQVFSIKQWKNHDGYDLSVTKNVKLKFLLRNNVTWLSFPLLLYWVFSCSTFSLGMKNLF